MEAMFKEYPNFFLGGFNSDHDGLESRKAMFTRFWERFRTCQPSHPIYQRTEEQRSCTIPIALHGDEGRGLARIPVLVLAYQVIIPFSGENELNSSKYPSCLGFLMNLGVDLKGFHFRLFVSRAIPETQAFLHNPAFGNPDACKLVRQEGCHHQWDFGGLGQ